MAAPAANASFPDYTSGHAIISASAEVLTYLRGAKLAYVDDPEIPFGSGQRPFRSFHQAAEEASISRFYGGIHYTESCTKGMAQGQQVGRFVVARLRSAGLQPFTAPAKPRLVGASAAPRPQKAQ